MNATLQLRFNKSMDFSELDDMLEEDTYIPTFNKAKPQNKSLTKNSSAKSIENASLPTTLPPPPAPPRTNLLSIHKQTRKEVMSFEDLLKNQNQPSVSPPQAPPRQQPKEVRFDVPKEVKKSTSKAGDSYWNDQEDDVPVVTPNRMKPPIIRRGDDNKSVASRRNEDNRSTASNAQFKRSKEDVEPFNNLSAPQPNFSISLTPPINPLQQTRQIKRESVPYSQPKQVTVVADTSELKRMLQEQLQLQRQFSQKIMKEEQEAHRREIQKLKQIHAEELRHKLELKSFEMEKLKEYYEMQLKARNERADELRQLQMVNRKVEEGIKALSRAEEELRTKTAHYEENIQNKFNQNKMISDFTAEKENHIQQLFSKLQARERDFREERQRGLAELQRERKRQEQAESRIYKRERELQEKYARKERVLVEEFDDKQRKLGQEESKMRLKRMELEQQKLKLQQEREEIYLRQRKAEESRVKLMQELQEERMKLASKEMEMASRTHQWETKENQLLLKEKEVAGRFKMIELERKRVEVEREMKRRPGYETKFSFDKTQIGPSPLEKSIKQLKDEYLRNLGHI